MARAPAAPTPRERRGSEARTPDRRSSADPVQRGMSGFRPRARRPCEADRSRGHPGEEHARRERVRVDERLTAKCLPYKDEEEAQITASGHDDSSGAPASLDAAPP